MLSNFHLGGAVMTKICYDRNVDCQLNEMVNKGSVERGVPTPEG